MDDPVHSDGAELLAPHLDVRDDVADCIIEDSKLSLDEEML
jgi:hypothetical protein